MAAAENKIEVMRVLLTHNKELAKQIQFVGLKLELFRIFNTQPDFNCSVLKKSDQNGDTPYHVAAQKGNTRILRLLINADRKVDMKNEDDRTALHLAASSGQLKAVRMLVQADGNLLQDDDADANTALHLACMDGHEHTVRFRILFKSVVYGILES